MDILFDIIVPYRDRASHLSRFIPHYRRHFPEANIIVVEQDNDHPFNRGWLLNCGFILSKSEYVIFSDVDMLIASGFHHYRKYPETPTQLATHVQQFGYQMPFPEYFGGVNMFNRHDFVYIDGMSNKFHGWSCEDNELYDTVIKSGLKISHRSCWYNSLHHDRPFDGICVPKSHPNYVYWKRGRDADDGLQNCKFEIKSITNNHYKIDYHEMGSYSWI